jgi:hypothetical protein
MWKSFVQRMAKEVAIETAILWAQENQRKVGDKDEKNIKSLINLLVQALAFTGRTNLTEDEVTSFFNKL